MTRKSHRDAPGSMFARWRESILVRFSRHPFPPGPEAPRSPTNAQGELTPEGLQDLDELQFEKLVAAFFTAVGFRTGVAAGDVGRPASVHLYHAGDARPFGLVQPKWHFSEVGLRSVQELLGLLTAEGLSEGYLVATGDFTPEARACDTRRKIMLLDGREFLIRFNRLARPTRAAILATVTKPAEIAEPVA